jgi:hypothetical protein
MGGGGVACDDRSGNRVWVPSSPCRVPNPTSKNLSKFIGHLWKEGKDSYEPTFAHALRSDPAPVVRVMQGRGDWGRFQGWPLEQWWWQISWSCFRAGQQCLAAY